MYVLGLGGGGVIVSFLIGMIGYIMSNVCTSYEWNADNDVSLVNENTKISRVASRDV